MTAILGWLAAAYLLWLAVDDFRTHRAFSGVFLVLLAGGGAACAGLFYLGRRPVSASWFSAWGGGVALLLVIFAVRNRTADGSPLFITRLGLAFLFAVGAWATAKYRGRSPTK
jgi:hypothetical protein